MTKKLKTAVVILSILLAISAIALAAMLIYKYVGPNVQTTVTVPNNLIASQTTKAETTTTPESSEDTTIPEDSEETKEGNIPGVNAPDAAVTEDTAANITTVATDTLSQIGTQEAKAIALYLHSRNEGDNVPFEVRNMFPGDVETKYFCVKVAYKDTVTVKYKADIRKGHEILAEVLKCRITLLTTGEVLYEGLMRDMPKSLDHTLNSSVSTETELYYQVTAYLETSVGNRYQNRRLIADFNWWVEDDGNLEPPQTGDAAQPIIIICVMVAIGLVLVPILLKLRKREEDDDE
jgi:hypothetical protein